MKKLLWVLGTYAIVISLIAFGMYMSPLSALVILILYVPACIISVALINRLMKRVKFNPAMRFIFLSVISVSVFAFPTWDAILGKYYLKKFCDKDGGIYVEKDARINSLYIPNYLKMSKDIELLSEDEKAKHYPGLQQTLDQHIEKIGVKFLEGDIKSGGYFKIFYDDGNFAVVGSEKLSSKYVSGSESTSYDIRKNRGLLVPGLYLTFSNAFYEEIDTGRRVAGLKDYSFVYRYDFFWEPIGALPHANCGNIYPKSQRFDVRNLAKLIRENH